MHPPVTQPYMYMCTLKTVHRILLMKFSDNVYIVDNKGKVLECIVDHNMIFIESTQESSPGGRVVLGWVRLCCLMTSDLIKDIRCHI